MSKRKSGRTRNMSAGHNWERECVNRLKHMFPHITTSRNESRSRDSYKIDLMNVNEYHNGVLPYEFQCKNYSKIIRYDQVLNSMPNKFPSVILHKHTEKRGNRFYEIGNYAIMKMDDFIDIISKLEKNENIKNISKTHKKTSR